MSNVVSIHGYDLHVIEDEPMVMDLDLAIRLGFSRARDIRKLVSRMVEAGQLKANQYRATVARLSNGADSTSFYLSEKAVLKVITKSETEKADQITDEMIDVFIDYRNGALRPKEFTRLELIEIARDTELKNQALMIENKAKEERIEKLENFFQVGTTIAAFGKMLNGVNCTQMSNYCHEELNWLYNESRSGKNKRWRAKSHARDKYLTETKRSIGQHGSDDFIKSEPKLLLDGAKKLYQLYLDGELPMKKTWNGELSHMKFAQEAA